MDRPVLSGPDVFANGGMVTNIKTGANIYINHVPPPPWPAASLNSLALLKVSRLVSASHISLRHHRSFVYGHPLEDLKATEMALPTPRSPQPESFTPPDSPRLAVPPQPLTVDVLVQALTKVLQQTRTNSTGKAETTQPKTSETPKSEEPKEKNRPGRASKFEYKTVNEMYYPISVAITSVIRWHEHSWDQSNGYKIKEATDTKKDVEEMDQYVFVLRKRFGTICRECS